MIFNKDGEQRRYRQVINISMPENKLLGIVGRLYLMVVQMEDTVKVLQEEKQELQRQLAEEGPKLQPET